LIHYIADPSILVLAYESIKSKPGNITPGVGMETLDGISLVYLNNLSKKIKEGRYKFSHIRRVWIPKPGKKENRPLGIASPREKVVQKAMHLVLEQVYEPTFLKTSHGFRPKKNPHSALKQVDVGFKGTVWFIEANISKCFDSISHKRLLAIISRKVKCAKTITLISSALKCDYVELGGI